MAAPGPRNLITDVAGIRVGQAEDRMAATGTTVVVPDGPAVASCAITGGAPGSRETALLEPDALVGRVDAIVLSGGSAFGLDAAAAVMERLAALGRGFAVGPSLVPIVPAAILFDLNFPGRRPRPGISPWRRLGRLAFDRAAAEFALGNAGAGFGATCGRLKGGVGSASLILADGSSVGAIVAVNAWGAAVRPDCGRFWAAELALPGEIDPQPPLPAGGFDPEDYSACKGGAPAGSGNTTIAVVAIDRALDKAQCRRLAIMAQDGIARAIRPAHTPFDGDTVFALATGSGPLASPAELLRLGAAAADCLARAIMRALVAAAPLGGVPSWRQVWGSIAADTPWPGLSRPPTS
jgi:L-aminopeptidase/D-esterase-like protein